jgi:hypothetical protein
MGERFWAQQGNDSTRRMSIRIAVAAAVCLALLCSAGVAHAAPCGSYNPVCPYQRLEVLGGTDLSSLNGPLAIALAPGGDVLVADQAKESVREFSSDGTLIGQIGTPGSYNDVNGVAVDQQSGEIWVSQYGRSIEGFNSAGTPNVTITDAALPAPLADAFFPAAIAVGPGGDLYVLDHDGDLIVFSPAGDEVTEFSVSSAFPSGLPTQPVTTIAVDDSGDVYVAPATGPIHEFDSSGASMATIADEGGGGIVIYGGQLYVEDSGEINSYELSTGAWTERWFGDFADDSSGVGPTFAVGGDGIDAATTNHSIEQFGMDGSEIGSWGSLAPDDFVPTEVLGDAAGNVYVLDLSNFRVIRYDPQGDPATVFADLSSYPGPDTAAIDTAGNLAVDVGDELLTFDSTGQITNTQPVPCCNELVGIDSDGDIYTYGYSAPYPDSGGVFRYSPTGQLLGSFALSADEVAVAPDGDVYADGPNLSEPNVGHVIAEFSDTGQQLATIDPIQGWPGGLPESLAVDAEGRLYAVVSDDTIRMYTASGTMLAVWPYQAGTLTADNGDLYATGPGNRVSVFSDFLDPLPALPPLSQNPFTQAITLSLLNQVPTASQLSFTGGLPSRGATVQVPVSCAGSASCSGSMVLTTPQKTRRASAAKTIVLGRAKFTLKPGAREVITVHLNSRARALLRHRSAVRATLTVGYAAGSTRKTLARAFTLRLRK